MNARKYLSLCLNELVRKSKLLHLKINCYKLVNYYNAKNLKIYNMITKKKLKTTFHKSD